MNEEFKKYQDLSKCFAEYDKSDKSNDMYIIFCPKCKHTLTWKDNAFQCTKDSTHRYSTIKKIDQ